MILPGVCWSEERTVAGTPPVGETEHHCIGCRAKFVAGEKFVARVVGPISLPFFAHPTCTERAEVRA